MPSELDVVEAIIGAVYNNLRWLYRYFGAPPPEEGFRQEAEAIAWMVLGTVRNGCTCSERWLPPNRREKDFWLAVERCEEVHQLTVRDLVRSGRLTPPQTITRPIDDQRAATATVDGAACEAQLTTAGPPVTLVAELLAAALRANFSPNWAYTSDEHFWRRQGQRGAWGRFDGRRLPVADFPISLQGRYLGYGVPAIMHANQDVTFNDVPHRSPKAAAASARDFVADLVEPSYPWRGLTVQPPANPLSLEARRDELWRTFFQPGYGDPQWLHDTCHEIDDEQIGWEAFWIHAAVGGMLPRAREFARSVMFHQFSFVGDGRPGRGKPVADRPLDCGEIIVCPGDLPEWERRCAEWERRPAGSDARRPSRPPPERCRHDSDGSACRACEAYGLKSLPPAELFFDIFLKGQRAPWPAWQCGRCGNCFYAADPRPTSTDVCPRCDGPHSPTTTAVMRPIHTFPAKDPDWFEDWLAEE
jgi:hypothetical protein